MNKVNKKTEKKKRKVWYGNGSKSYYLDCQYDPRKSFYGKAVHIKTRKRVFATTWLILWD